MKHFIILTIALLYIACMQAQANTKTADVEPANSNTISVMIVLDASNSMQQRWDGYRKYNVATDLLTSMMDYYYRRYPNVQFAVRLFGHQHDMQLDRCDDSELVVEFTNRNIPEISARMTKQEPKGWSPIQFSLEQALKDFKNIYAAKKKLILISDGGETCQGNPCIIAQEMRDQGIDIEPFVIGMSDNMFLKEDLGCIGNYRQAANAKEFNVAIYDIMEDFFRKTTVQIYFTDAQKSYYNTDINFSFNNLTYQQEMEDYVHSLNDKKQTDTLEVLSSGKYEMVTHTFPPLKLESIKLDQQTHNIVEVDAKQGLLTIEALEGRGFAYYDVIIKDPKTGKTVNVQQIGESIKYLEGIYDVEITSRPSTVFKQVEIKQGQNVVLKVKRSGSFLFENRSDLYGTLYYVSEDGFDEVFVFDGLFGRRRVDILSGKYQFVYRYKNASQHETVTESFEIQAGNVYHSIIK